MRYLALAILLWTMASGARAESHYEGLQIAPTLHGVVAPPHLRGGVGIDLSVGRWLDVELWGARVSRPNGSRWYPGAWATGLAVHSRVAGRSHAFVYGVGLAYTSTHHCPQGCALGSAIVLEEPRSAVALWTAEVRAGYELRLERHWFARALVGLELPFHARRVDYYAPDARYEQDEPPLTFLHGQLLLTVGYAFRLD